MSRTVIVPGRFNGPPSSGNGGFSAGSLVDAAGLAPMRATVQLRKPPPLDTPMDVTRDDGWVLASHAGEVVMRARESEGEPDLVPPVGLEEARAAEATYAGLTSHPFPTCVVCGTDRAPGDGLRVFPGRVAAVDGRDRVAATWTPEEVSVPLTWAALDCIGAWAGDLGERHLVLGSMTATYLEVPAAGRTHVVMGGDRGTEGRKTFTASTLYRDDGRAVATAEHVWFAVDPADFG